MFMSMVPVSRDIKNYITKIISQSWEKPGSQTLIFDKVLAHCKESKSVLVTTSLQELPISKISGSPDSTVAHKLHWNICCWQKHTQKDSPFWNAVAVNTLLDNCDSNNTVRSKASLPRPLALIPGTFLVCLESPMRVKTNVLSFHKIRTGKCLFKSHYKSLKSVICPGSPKGWPMKQVGTQLLTETNAVFAHGSAWNLEQTKLVAINHVS